VTTNEAHTPVKRTARLAGGLYVSLVPLGIISFVYVPSLVLVPGDAAATSRSILASEWLFRIGIVSHLISQVIVIFLVLALYRLLRPVKPERAVVMSVLALLCVPISFVAEVNAVGALHLLANSTDAAFTPDQVQAQAMRLLDMRRSGVLIAQVFWGLWMLPMATLVFRSRFLPKWLSVPVLIVAVGYLFDSSAHLLLPGRATISQFTALGELVLPLWLLVRGVDVELWHRVARGHEVGESLRSARLTSSVRE
jgi:hypothetical protein